jgi:hypothetical protein
MVQNTLQKQPSVCSLVVDTKDLPPFVLQNTHDPVPEVTYYLQVLADDKTSDAKRCLILPSIITLAHFFNVVPEEVIAALRNLKQEGYYNISGGLYGHISLYGKEQHQGWTKGTTSKAWQWLSRPHQNIINSHLLNVS